ncbi:MAG: phosphate/phosphite/phosphonate ABC transporter substrate-binding protein [Deltaproteobacteria bacterium]|nr:phosphate/phosphite/phosphonate ABC transporter substrate-binding protein [Deltaproteobacteria bacterium]
MLFTTNHVTEVDMKTTAQSTPAALDSDQRPVLRVAIGAMISPRITKQYYADLLKWVGDKVGRRTIMVQRKTYAEVNALIEQKEIDLAFVCSGPYIQGKEKFGLELAAVPVVGGKKVYYSYIIVNAQSDIKTFDDLRGKRFAFTDPDSNTGCLVPKYMLARRQLTPKTFFKETFFTYSHDNAIKAVSDGLADGAAVDSLIWEFMRATAPAAVEKTVVILKSPPYGIPPLVVHPSLDPTLKAQLKSVLFSLHKDSQARRFLKQVRIDRFEEGSDALYETVRQMNSWQKNNQ